MFYDQLNFCHQESEENKETKIYNIVKSDYKFFNKANTSKEYNYINTLIEQEPIDFNDIQHSTYDSQINPEFNQYMVNTINKAIPICFNNFNEKEIKKINRNLTTNPLRENYTVNYNKKHGTKNVLTIKTKKHEKSEKALLSNFNLCSYKGGLFDNNIKKNELFLEAIKVKKAIKEKQLNDKVNKNDKDYKSSQPEFIVSSNLDNYGKKEMRLFALKNNIYALKEKLKSEMNKKVTIKKEMASLAIKSNINNKQNLNNNNIASKNMVKSHGETKVKEYQNQNQHMDNNQINTKIEQEENQSSENKFEKIKYLPSDIIPNITIIINSLLEEIIEEQVEELNKIDNLKQNRNTQLKMVDFFLSDDNLFYFNQIIKNEEEIIHNLNRNTIKPYVNNRNQKIQLNKYFTSLPLINHNNISEYKENYHNFQKCSGVFFTQNVFDLYTQATDEIFKEILSEELHLFSKCRVDNVAQKALSEVILDIN